MLTIFPLTYLVLVAHALLRVITGATLLFFGGRRLTKTSRALPHRRTLLVLGALETLLGMLFIVGFVTQLAALGAILLATALLIAMRRHDIEVPGRAYYVLLIAISLSLFMTGAGAFAVDLPF